MKEINNGWYPEVLGINLSIGNVCNYRCSYCFPGANEGNYKFPDFDILKKNTKHLLDYYLLNKKKIFDISFVGGEPTHWPYLIDYIKFLKENYNCLISMTSNGSKDIEVWKRLAPYFDRVTLSCHHDYVKIDDFVDICDYLYGQNVVVSTSVMMHPDHWDYCMSLVERLLKSKHKFTIRYSEILGPNINYTEEQKNILQKHRARKANWLWFLKNNKYYISKVILTEDNDKKIKVDDNYLILNKLNNFLGWECSLGKDWIAISHNGIISGLCGQNPFDKLYNIRDKNFTDLFFPTYKSVICMQNSCNCMAETNMPKKKIIPICIK